MLSSENGLSLWVCCITSRTQWSSPVSPNKIWKHKKIIFCFTLPVWMCMFWWMVNTVSTHMNTPSRLLQPMILLSSITTWAILRLSLAFSNHQYHFCAWEIYRSGLAWFSRYRSFVTHCGRCLLFTLTTSQPFYLLAYCHQLLIQTQSLLPLFNASYQFHSFHHLWAWCSFLRNNVSFLESWWVYLSAFSNSLIILVTTRGSTYNTLLLSTYWTKVHCLQFIIMLSTHLS